MLTGVPYFTRRVRKLKSTKKQLSKLSGGAEAAPLKEALAQINADLSYVRE
jgi:hypothetical protein